MPLKKRCVTCGQVIINPRDVCPRCYPKEIKIENPIQPNLYETSPSESANLWKATSFGILSFGLLILLLNSTPLLSLVVVVLGILCLLASFQAYEEQSKPRIEFRAICPCCKEVVTADVTESSEYLEKSNKFKYRKAEKSFKWKVNKDFIDCSNCGARIAVPKVSEI